MHGLEEAFRYFVSVVPLTLLGAPLHTYVGAQVARRVIDLYQHSMLPWTYGWLGRWLVYSPIGHRLHHSAEEEHWNRNYGDIFVIWDRLFGTWYKGARVNPEVDVSDNPYNRRAMVTEYWHCAVLCFKSLRASVRTGRWRANSDALDRMRTAGSS
jgi:sterol desaturase/sphingolipid hydroxylase (fatty acid hydroxylase superfamily)